MAEAMRCLSLHGQRVIVFLLLNIIAQPTSWRVLPATRCALAPSFSVRTCQACRPASKGHLSGLTSAFRRRAAQTSIHRTAVPGTAIEAKVISGNPLISDKKGKAGGGGGGDGPTPLQQLQVVIYRCAVLLTGVCWYRIFTTDFAMVTGISMDGSEQAWYLRAADICAGIAACSVPTGSLIGAGILMRSLGLAAIGSVALSSLGFGTLGAVAGPLSALLILAREVYWYGMLFRGGNIVGMLTFFYIAWIRFRAQQPGAEVVDLPMESLANNNTAIDLPLFVAPKPFGPPIPVSFLASASTFTSGCSKLFDPIGLDLDEEGDMFSKRSSRDLKESGFPSFKPDLSKWLPPVENRIEIAKRCLQARHDYDLMTRRDLAQRYPGKYFEGNIRCDSCGRAVMGELGIWHCSKCKVCFCKACLPAISRPTATSNRGS